MLSPRSIDDEGSSSGSIVSGGLRHYPSTPHLDTFRSQNGSMGINNYVKKDSHILSTFTSFSNNPHHHHHQNYKSGFDLRYRDDPNPYKVSTIDEYQVQVQDPYKTKSSIQLNKINNRSIMTFYTDEDEILQLQPPSSSSSNNNTSHHLSLDHHHSTHKYYQSSEASNNSGDGGYEIPDPDYEGSTDSSEDLPPLPTNLQPICDSSEEYSQLSLSATSTSGGPSPCPVLSDNMMMTTPTKISDADRIKIEYALRGRKTWIYVSDSLANLYYMSKLIPTPASRPNSSSSSSSSTGMDSLNADWILKYTGVPVLLLDTGETKSRDKRKIQIILAELGSGLALWKDVIDNLTSYRVVETEGTTTTTTTNTTTSSHDNNQISSSPISTFHTMHVSSDHTRIMGLSFDNPDTAEKFAKNVDKLTSDFANISLSGSKNKKRDGKKNKDNKIKTSFKYIKPKKSDISQPCGFQHVSSLSPKDKNLFSSLQHFVNTNGHKSGSKSPTVSDVSF